ncbi:sensor histidine kinase [Paenibacillus sp. CAA11]|uniref:sensor histidine kinase n=1 Tax=Paenibacillus sp. CAA11 TaxID=1532905 RepID=UPI00131EDFCC|nr:ATP-binding protein [Paenibacillus sp. CAA11]
MKFKFKKKPAENPQEDVLFRQTQNRLTVQYCIMLTIFLSLFVFCVYTFLRYLITQNQEHALHEFMEQESRYMNYIVADNSDTDLKRALAGNFSNGDGDTYYCILDSNQNLVMGTDNITKSGIQDQILSKLQSWPEGKDYIYVKADLPEHAHFDEHRPASFKERTLLFTAQPLWLGEQLVGTFYLGKDVTSALQILQNLIIVMLLIAILFVGVALLISRHMSKRAMVPIIQSYTRQREFAADASHELRTPLSVLLSSIDTLQMEETLTEEPFTRRVLSNMKDEIKRMSGLTHDLLILARSDASALPLHQEELDLSALAASTFEIVKPLGQIKHLKMEVNTPAQLQVLGDKSRLHQLLLILLDNAVKYTQENGEVTLSVYRVVEKKQNFVCIAVEDTGIGIPSDALDRIFDRFYRVEKSRARQTGAEGGHGLGLSIAQAIVHAHHGTIKAISQPGKGSRFEVRIPLLQQKQAAV